jgi:hypothetical protein
LNPGGYLELVDVCFPVQDIHESMPSSCALRQWSDLMLEAMKAAGCPLDSAKSYKTQLETAGFVDVVERVYYWPQNTWPKDKKYKELGMSIFLHCT